MDEKVDEIPDEVTDEIAIRHNSAITCLHSFKIAKKQPKTTKATKQPNNNSNKQATAAAINKQQPKKLQNESQHFYPHIGNHTKAKRCIFASPSVPKSLKNHLQEFTYTFLGPPPPDPRPTNVVRQAQLSFEGV